MMEVAIIGSGISGLSVAHHLKKAGVEVKVFEKEEVLGGNIQSEYIDGYLCELGPQTVLADSKMEDFLKDLHLEPIYANPSSKKRYIYKKGRLVALPLSPLEFITSPFLSFSGKLRLLREPFVPKSPKKEESIAEFVRRRFGKEFLDYVVAPFVSGVYAGDPEELSVKYAVRKVYELEERYGSVIRGAIKLKALGPSGKLISFKDGNKTLINKLSEKLEVLKGNVVLRIRRKDEFFLLDTKEGKFSAKAVVVATPSTSASYLLRDLSWSVSEEFDKIYYAPVLVMHISVNAGSLPEGFGFLVPRREGKRILGVIFSSQLFAGRSPKGKDLLTLYLGGATDPQIVDYSDEAVVSIVEKELKEILKIEHFEIIRITRWKKGIPQYTLGYGRYLDLANSIEKEQPGLFLTGNYLYGVSVADCIRASYQVAQRVLEFLELKKGAVV
ncbi:protoporphyrinogen oxidase [Hydrogenobacter hydrogenophilus]|uniref:Coproporphyrinogen III oxidase n=1 Tax=Hydrogenobacter hydrogenophilus TaxID=35835 RepID=A0A285NZZ1_9AQUI|nr:protoporphyrinogen oxidase [Hydrogenobacter hydrogenophilus]SNZ15045.1 oxygen-dependent protoporphyrinogen oxidase [Hydrogenobacter hydrogenophilus]